MTGEQPKTFSVSSTTSGVGPVYCVSPMPLLPLVKYQTMSMATSCRTDDTNDPAGTGVDQNGYITNWIASPRDAMDRSLYLSGQGYDGEIDKTLNVDSRDNVTVSWYSFFDMEVDPVQHTTGLISFLKMDEYTAFLPYLFDFWGSFEMQVQKSNNGTADYYTFELLKHNYVKILGHPYCTSTDTIALFNVSAEPGPSEMA